MVARGKCLVSMCRDDDEKGVTCRIGDDVGNRTVPLDKHSLRLRLSQLWERGQQTRAISLLCLAYQKALCVGEVPMEIQEAIYSRRSVRDFTDEPVARSIVNKLLEAAVQAPSAMNEQPWTFVVIQNKALLQSYSNRAKTLFLETMKHDPKLPELKEMLTNPSFNVFYNSGTLIVIFAKPLGRHPDWDCCFAAQTLMLAALGRGLGTCPIGLVWPLFEDDEIKQELNVPKPYRVVLPISVGYPQHPVDPVARAEPEILCWE